MPPGSEKETPLQKYQRLNCEVRELLDDIQTVSSDGKGEVACLDESDSSSDIFRWSVQRVGIFSVTPFGVNWRDQCPARH